MNTTNAFQVLQKTYDLMDYDPEFKGILGNIPMNVLMVVFGDSGHGKTEYVMRMVKSYCKKGVDVDWISYEQGHGLDMQMALRRNNMIELGKMFHISDPNHKKDPNTTYLQDLIKKIKGRNSSDVFVIDSLQYLGLTVKEYYELKNMFSKKGFIFISHKQGKLPEGTTAIKIGYDGGLRILVKNYIAYPEKNRFGGTEPYIIWEERARLLEQKFFAERDKQERKTLFNQPENAQNSLEA
jgi:hypothetical protein